MGSGPCTDRNAHMLVVQVFTDNGWAVRGQLLPTDPSGNITDNPTRTRQIYLFECLGDQSAIYRVPIRLDVKLGEVELFQILVRLGY